MRDAEFAKFMFLFVALVIVIVIAGCVFGQTPSASEVLAAKENECQHRSSVEYQQRVQLRGGPAMKITYFDGKRLDFVMQDRYMTEVRGLTLDKFSDVPEGFAKGYDNGTWWLLYCGEHFVLNRIERHRPPKETARIEPKKKP